MESDKIIKFTDDNFDSTVVRSKVPVLVDFWADWCGPCRALSPLINKLAEEYDGKILVGKVNVDECPKLAATFRIMSIPTLIIFQAGISKDKILGLRSIEELKSFIDKNIK